MLRHQLIVLNESRLSDLIRKYPKSEVHIKELAAGDPSGNQKYLDWMVRTFIRYDNPPEDIVRAVREFHKKVAHLPKKDIGSYHGIWDLLTTVDENPVSKTTMKKELQSQVDRVYEDDDWVVVHPHTEKAAQKYGFGAQWCVSASLDNKFCQYSERENIGLYFIMHRDPEYKFPDKVQRNKFGKIAISVYPKNDIPQSLTRIKYGRDWYAFVINDGNNQMIDLDIVASKVGKNWHQIWQNILKHRSDNPKTKSRIEKDKINAVRFPREKAS